MIISESYPSCTQEEKKEMSMSLVQDRTFHVWAPCDLSSTCNWEDHDVFVWLLPAQVLESVWTDSLNRHKVGSTKTGGRGTAGLKKTAKGYRGINVPASTNFTIMLHFLISKIEGIFSLFFQSEKAREYACIWARNTQHYGGSRGVFAKGVCVPMEMEEQHGAGDQAAAPGWGGWALPLAHSESLVHKHISSPLWFFLCRMKEGQFVEHSED